MKNKKFAAVFVAAVLCAALLGGCSAQAAAQSTPSAAQSVQSAAAPAALAESGSTVVGSPARNFSFTLLDGSAAQLSDYVGKPIVLNFWATWCTFCVQEFPDMERLHGEYGEDVVFLMVDLGEDADTVSAFLSENNYTFTAGLAGDAAPDGYDLVGIPLTVILDAGGTVQFTQVGKGSYSVFKEQLDPLLG